LIALLALVSASRSTNATEHREPTDRPDYTDELRQRALGELAGPVLDGADVAKIGDAATVIDSGLPGVVGAGAVVEHLSARQPLRRIERTAPAIAHE